MVSKKQLGFHIDQQSCIGCFTCQIACKDKNDLEVGQRWRRVEEVSLGGYVQEGKTIRANVSAFWITMGCNHCEKPKCVENCPSGALSKREEDGVVLIDQDICIGCRYCVWACPYEAPQFNEEKGVTGKCNMCIDLLEEGQEPACVAACPIGVINYGDVEELKSKFGGVKDIIGLPDSGITKPSLFITPHKDAVK